MIDSTDLYEVCIRALKEMPGVVYRDAHYFQGEVSSGSFTLDNYPDAYSAVYSSSIGKLERQYLLQERRTCLHLQDDSRPLARAYIIARLRDLREGSVKQDFYRVAKRTSLPEDIPLIYTVDAIIWEPSDDIWLQEVYDYLVERLSAD